MQDRAGRKERVDAYKRSHPEAGVYRIVNRVSGRALVASAANLASVRSRLAFARSTGSTGALDYRLVPDVRRFGFEALELEVLDTLRPPPESTAQEIAAELATLEALWRERFPADALY